MRKFFLLVALVAGCGGVPGAQEADPIAVSGPAPLDPSLLVGCWSVASAAGTYRLSFNGDGTMVYAGVKFNGNPIGYTGTWSADVNRLVVTAPNWASALSFDYSVNATALVLTPFVPATGGVANYQRVSCP